MWKLYQEIKLFATIITLGAHPQQLDNIRQ